MNKYFNTITNTRGDSLPGYRVQVTDSDGIVVPIYADRSSTPFTDASGNVVNYATTDSNGAVEFFWEAADGQVLQTLDITGELIRAVDGFADNFVLDNLGGSIAQSVVTNLTADLAARPTSAALAASGGAALVGTSPTGNVQTALAALAGDTFASIGDQNIPSAIQRVQTTGYSTAGDGGHAWYKRVVAEPTHAGKFQDAGGQWWEIDEETLFVEQFGGHPDIADNSAAIAAVIDAVPDVTKNSASTDANPNVFWGGARVNFRFALRYDFASRITVPSNKAIIFTSQVPRGTHLRFTGTSWDCILFEDKGVAGRFGFDGVSVEGGDIICLGGSSSGLILRNGYHSHAKRLGFAILDSIYYHNNDTAPAKTVTAIAATNPVRVTSTAHGFASGDKIAMLDCEGEERVNGQYWITVIDADTFDLYTNAGRTTGLNGTTYLPANFTGGLATKGRTPVSSSGGSFTWTEIRNWQFEASVGHQLYVASDSFLLFHGDIIRFRLSGTTPLVVDAGGCRFESLEFIGVEEDNASDEAFIWFPCRLNDNSQIIIDNARFGTEEVPTTPGATFIGGDYTQKRWAPARRKILVGPKDGSTAKTTISAAALMNIKWYGSDAVNEVGLDLNAGSQNVTIGGAGTEIKSFAVTGALIKCTHADAGRSQVSATNVLEGDLAILTASFLGKIFHTGSGGWINRQELNVVRARTGLSISTGSGVGTGTVTAGANDNSQLFTLTITPAGTPSGQTVATITLPVAYPRSVKPQITPANSAATALGVWGYQSASTTGFTLRAPSTLVAGTAYTVDVMVRGCA